MSISDTANARKYASIAEVAAAQAKLSADKLDNAPDYAAQAAASAVAAASSAQVAVSAESVVNSLAISASESATQAAASAAEAGDAASAAIGQCIRVPEGELISVLPAAVDRTDSFMAFDSSGNTELLSKSDVAILDNTGKIPVSMIPAIAITETYVVSSQAAMLALDAQVGDVAKRTDLGYSFILSANPPSTLANWVQLNDDVLAQLGQPSGAGEVGALTQSGASSTVQSVLDSHVEKTSLAASAGAGTVGLSQGGTVQKALTSIYLDGFIGVDNTGNTDSTAGIQAAIISVFGSLPNSCYVVGTQTFVKFKFGRGSYMVGDIVLPSGCVFEGESEWVTRIKLKPGATWGFTTVGTQDFATGGITKRYVGGGIRNMTIGAGYVESIGTMPAGVGGIKAQYASWFQMEHVTLKYIDGTALHFDELWDADIMTTQIQACGLGYTSSNNVVGLHMGPGTSANDGCNAIRFTGFHLEGCPKLFEILERTRHVSFAEAKLEATTTGVSSIIQGVNEISFPNAELSWQRADFPMIYAASGDSDGVSFNGARLISSSATPGWYFQYNSANGPLKLNNIHARAVKKIVDGSNIQMDGASSWFSGPCLVTAFQKAQIHSCDFRANRPSTATDGTEDAIVFTSTDCEAVNNIIECGGSNSDGAAAINITSGATNAKVSGNTLAGSKQYGLRQNAAVTSKWIRDNRLSATANYGSLMTGSTPLYTIASPNSAGLGAGGVNGTSTPITISNSASATGIPAGGCTLMLVRGVYNSSANIASALILIDASTSTIQVFSQTATSGTVIQTGTGAAGDGSIRISKSGSAVTFNNFTGTTLTLNISTLSAIA